MWTKHDLAFGRMILKDEKIVTDFGTFPMVCFDLFMELSRPNCPNFVILPEEDKVVITASNGEFRYALYTL
jgi:hypothetical protein